MTKTTRHPRLTIKRVYDAPAETDGVRVLVDRLWPRGMTKERAAIDIWAKDIAPSPDLRKWFDHEPERFEPFAEAYRKELAASPAPAALLAELRGRHATLLYGAHDPAINHAVVLAAYLKTLS
jgi:uncharacterized protein YeaO (DUF488 family)